MNIIQDHKNVSVYIANIFNKFGMGLRGLLLSNKHLNSIKFLYQ